MGRQKGHTMSSILTRVAFIAMANAATLSFAFASELAQPETAGLPGPQAVAESRHQALQHGLPQVKPLEVQAAGHEKAQAAAEAIHLKKMHGNVNDSANRRLEIEHPNH